jgi:hypothetical protein
MQKESSHVLATVLWRSGNAHHHLYSLWRSDETKIYCAELCWQKPRNADVSMYYVSQYCGAKRSPQRAIEALTGQPNARSSPRGKRALGYLRAPGKLAIARQ